MKNGKIIFLAGAIGLALTACGNKSEDTPVGKDTSVETQTAENKDAAAESTEKASDNTANTDVSTEAASTEEADNGTVDSNAEQNAVGENAAEEDVEDEIEELEPYVAEDMIYSFLDWTALQYMDYDMEFTALTANEVIPMSAYIAYMYYDEDGFEEVDVDQYDEEDIDVDADEDDEEDADDEDWDEDADEDFYDDTYSEVLRIPYSTLKQVMQDYFGTTYELSQYIGGNDNIQVEEDSVLFTVQEWDDDMPDYFLSSVDPIEDGKYIAYVAYSIVDGDTGEDSGFIYIGEYTFTPAPGTPNGYVITDMRTYNQ